jgi:hypothetical protein
MDGVCKKRIDGWKKIYLFYLKKVTLSHGGKQLVLKNPSNTARVKLLLEMFPDAKFVHIYRNPYHTFLSKMRNIEMEMVLYCLQKPQDKQDFEAAMVKMYNRMYEKYFEEKKLIPKGNLVEVRYEDLIKDPSSVIKKIYDELKISGLEKFEKQLKDYIKIQSKIKTYKYDISENQKKKIYSYFSKTIDLWGY